MPSANSWYMSANISGKPRASCPIWGRKASAATGRSATRSQPRATRDLNWRNQTWTTETGREDINLAAPQTLSGGDNDREQLLLAGRARSLRASRHRQSRLEMAARSALANSPTQLSASSMLRKITPFSSPPGTPAQAKSSSRCMSVRAAPPIPTSISSLSSIRSAVAFPLRRTIRRRQPGWEISPVCASGMMCVRNTNFSRKNSTETSLALVVGGSMGAQQTYEWAVRYPDMVRRAAPIAGTARNTIHDFLHGNAGRRISRPTPALTRAFTRRRPT